MAGFALGLAGFISTRERPSVALLILLAATAAPMWWLEWARHRNLPKVTFLATPSQRRRWRAAGLIAGLPIWAFTLNVLPLAGTTATTVSGFWIAIQSYWPLLLLGVTVYVALPGDAPPHGLENVGRWYFERGSRFPGHALRDHLVKAFFLPLMLTFCFNWAEQAAQANLTSDLDTFAVCIAGLYLIDTTFATVGYLSTNRSIDAHIRSSNPRILGWLAALVCYPPLFTWLQNFGFNYRDGYLWSNWLEGNAFLLGVWGSAIVLLTTVYALSTVVFGPRFSNLTHRGIITHGPYRLTKHPAYISKNASWWLISIPFISQESPWTAVLHCSVLILMNCIYWLRARTEELHLMEDPDYQAYAAWIAEHGLAAKCRELLRF